MAIIAIAVLVSRLQERAIEHGFVLARQST
jgi:hypothetical protein